MKYAYPLISVAASSVGRAAGLLAIAVAAPASSQEQDVAEPVASLFVDGLEHMARFGAALALDDDRLAVSTPVAHRGDGGVLFFFARTPTGWARDGLFFWDSCYPEGHEFHCMIGSEVSLLGDRAVVSAFGGDFWDGTGGMAFVLNRTPGVGWSLEQILRSPQVPGLNKFGFGLVVAQNQKTLAISGSSYPVNDIQRGAVYLFERRDGSRQWTLIQTLIVPREGAFGFGRFGASLAMAEETLVVGEPVPYGRAHVYTRATDLPPGEQWVLNQTLYKPGAIDYEDYFGWAVAVDPETLTIVVGDPQDPGPFVPRPGRAHIFEHEPINNTWHWAAQLEPIEPLLDSSNDRFGSEVAADAGLVLVGGPRETYLGSIQGSAELFKKVDGAWTRVRRYALENPGPWAAGLGSAVDIDRGTVVAGAEGWQSSEFAAAGATFVYEEGLGSTFCTAEENSTGVAGRLLLLGSERALQEELTFAVHQLPLESTALIACGLPGHETPLGVGRLCLGTPYRRAAGPFMFPASGSVYVEPESWIWATVLQPGTTAAFQCLYRDPGGNRPNTNTSNAVLITML